MQSMRVFLMAGLCFVGAVAPASFDMAMVTDSGTNSVHRLDPINNVYLGSFGGGILTNPRGIVVNQNIGTAYVLDAYSRVSAWNYNTGAFISSFNSGVFGAKFLTGNSDGTLNVTGDTYARRFTTSGTTLTFYSRNGLYDTQQGIRLNDGNFYMSTRTGDNSTLEFFNYSTGAYIGSAGWTADRLMPIPTTSGGNTLNAYVSTGLVYLELDYMQNGPSFATFGSTTLIDTVAGVAPGHGGMAFIAGRDRANPTRGGLVRFDMNALTAGPTLAGTSYIQTPTGLATVVAPEPATMLALGGGLAMLLRRRKRG